MKMKRKMRIIAVVSFIFCIFVCCASHASEDSLPKTGDIALLVEGPEEHVPRVETNIINIIRARGFRVVDEAKMKKIRLAAARALADKYILYGEKSKVLKINATYNVAATIIATITPEEARENRIKLFTGTASVSIVGVKNNGVKLGGQTSVSKQIGYTQAEALRKAVDEAVKNGMQQLF